MDRVLSAFFLQYRRLLSKALGDEVTPPQAQMLHWIASQPGIHAGQLAQQSGRDKASITRLLAPLLAAGWVKRSPDPSDQRRQCLHLSATGEHHLAGIQLAREQVYATLLAPLNSAEQQHLHTLLQKCLASPSQ